MRQVLGLGRAAKVVQATVNIGSESDAMRAILMGAKNFGELIGFVKHSEIAAHILERVDVGSYAIGFASNINNDHDMAVALSGGLLPVDIGVKFASRIHSTYLAAEALARNKITSFDIQASLISAFERSNESREDKALNAQKILQVENLDESLVSRLCKYVEGLFVERAPRVESKDAAFALAHAQIDRDTQLGLIKCMNNSRDFAMALSGGFLDKDYALMLATKIYSPQLAVIALQGGAVFSLPVQEALIGSFERSNEGKVGKAECALEILRKARIDEKFIGVLQSYIASNVVILPTASDATVIANTNEVVKLDDLSVEETIALLEREDANVDTELKSHAVALLASSITDVGASPNYATLVDLTKALASNGVKSEDLEDLLSTTALGQEIWRQAQTKPEKGFDVTNGSYR